MNAQEDKSRARRDAIVLSSITANHSVPGLPVRIRCISWLTDHGAMRLRSDPSAARVGRVARMARLPTDSAATRIIASTRAKRRGPSLSIRSALHQLRQLASPISTGPAHRSRDRIYENARFSYRAGFAHIIWGRLVRFDASERSPPVGPSRCRPRRQGEDLPPLPGQFADCDPSRCNRPILGL